jgi:hypothetical protein
MDTMRCTGLRSIGIGAACLGLILGPLPLAFADGPGYGGDAGQLAVSWEAAAPVVTTPELPLPAPSTPQLEPQAGSMGGSVHGISAAFVLPPAADPRLNPDALALVVRGLGFRGKSAVEVRIGSDLPITTRADGAGALSVTLNRDAVGAAKPGVSVMAVGRNQSGTQVTLFGSIPPLAGGSGPMTLVPWAVGSIAVAGLAVWVRRRHALYASSD